MTKSYTKSTEYPPVPVLRALFTLMQNGNPLFHFVMAFCDGGLPFHRRAKRITFEQAIAWTLATILGKTKPGKEFAFAPISKNKRNESFWAVFDCDDHTPGSENAIKIGNRLLAALKRIAPETQYLYEHSGRGTHLFLFSWKPRPCAQWAALLHAIAFEADVTFDRGLCEALPSSDESAEFGAAMRVPASFNPVTRTLSKIIEHNIDAEQVLAATAIATDAPSFPKRKKDFLSFPEESPPKGANLSSETAPAGAEFKNAELIRETVSNPVSVPILPPASDADELLLTAAIYPEWARSWSKKFAITVPRTRHNHLSRLTGHSFHQTSHSVALQIVRRQYAEKTVPTRASALDHGAEFDDLWSRLQARWLAELDSQETEAFNKLTTDVERDAFRVIRSYWRLAAAKGAADFPVARDNLALRLGVTPQYAGQIRATLTSLNVITQTRSYQPHKMAACYAWMLKKSPAPTTAVAPAETPVLPVETMSGTASPSSDSSSGRTSGSSSASCEITPEMPLETPIAQSQKVDEARVTNPASPRQPESTPVTGQSQDPPLETERRVYRWLEAHGARSREQLQIELPAFASSLLPALQRLERCLCIRLCDGRYAIGCDPAVSIIRETLERLTERARAKHRVDIYDRDWHFMLTCNRPPIRVKELETAFHIAVTVGVLKSDGTAGPFLGLGCPLPRTRASLPSREPPNSQSLQERQDQTKRWLEGYVRRSRNS